MLYYFDADIATEHGIEEAVMLNFISYWVFVNKANDRNLRDGYYWTYNSLVALERIFPFWDYKKIGRILQKLEDKKVILSKNYNNIKFDRTKWYTIIDQSISEKMEFDFSKLGNRSPKYGRPIPFNKTYNIQNNNQPIKGWLDSDFSKVGKTGNETLSALLNRKDSYIESGSNFLKDFEEFINMPEHSLDDREFLKNKNFHSINEMAVKLGSALEYFLNWKGIK